MPITTGYVASSYLLPDPYFNGGDAVNTISYGGKTYRKHTFSSVGSSTLSMVYAGIVNYAIVGGGGSGGAFYGGGGGAGAFYTGTIGISSSQTVATGAGGGNVGQEDGYDQLGTFNITAPASLTNSSYTFTIPTGLSVIIGASLNIQSQNASIDSRTVTSYNSTTGTLVTSTGTYNGSTTAGSWQLIVLGQRRGISGNPSSIGSLVVAPGGGGGGCSKDFEISAARTGGSGGGSGAEPFTANVRSGAASTGGGNSGGSSYGAGAGGGGGYGSVGASATSLENGANGGSGTSVDILGTTYRLAAGGGGSTSFSIGTANGSGGLVSGVKIGGDGGSVFSPTYSFAQPGVANTGSGGGGWGVGQGGAPPGYNSSGAGGSGLVIIWYEINV
jgi:hypothetical protein